MGASISSEPAQMKGRGIDLRDSNGHSLAVVLLDVDHRRLPRGVGFAVEYQRVAVSDSEHTHVEKDGHHPLPRLPRLDLRLLRREVGVELLKLRENLPEQLGFSYRLRDSTVVRIADQLSQGLQDWVVGFFSSEALDALSPSNSQIWLEGGLLMKSVDESRFFRCLPLR